MNSFEKYTTHHRRQYIEFSIWIRFETHTQIGQQVSMSIVGCWGMETIFNGNALSKVNIEYQIFTEEQLAFCWLNELTVKWRRYETIFAFEITSLVIEVHRDFSNREQEVFLCFPSRKSCLDELTSNIGENNFEWMMISLHNIIIYHLKAFTQWRQTICICNEISTNSQ